MRNNMKGILFIIALIAVVAGFYFFFVVPNRTIELSPANKISTPAVADEATYNSVGFGFSFRYPSDWVVKETAEGQVVVKPNYNIPDDVAPISIDATGIEPYRQASQSIGSAIANKEEQKVKVGSYEGIQISGRLEESLGENAGLAVIFTMLNRDGNLFSIDYTDFPSAPQNAKDVYKSLVASLSFLN